MGRISDLFGRRPAVPLLPEGRRTYAIGDVHGRLDLLEGLLDAIAGDSARRGDIDAVEIILLGDLVDRGPASAGVVRCAMAGVDWAEMHVLMGNHEALMLDALDGNKDALRTWLKVGGSEALASWGVDPAVVEEGGSADIVAAARRAVPPAERAWIAARPLSLRRGDFLFVHAGVRPGIALERQAAADLLWIREPFLESARDHGATVVHGHSVRAEVEDRGNRIGIDTGAWASGRLTALGLQGAERWQVDVVG